MPSGSFRLYPHRVSLRECAASLAQAVVPSTEESWKHALWEGFWAGEFEREETAVSEDDPRDPHANFLTLDGVNAPDGSPIDDYGVTRFEVLERLYYRGDLPSDEWGSCFQDRDCPQPTTFVDERHDRLTVAYQKLVKRTFASLPLDGQDLFWRLDIATVKFARWLEFRKIDVPHEALWLTLDRPPENDPPSVLPGDPDPLIAPETVRNPGRPRKHTDEVRAKFISRLHAREVCTGSLVEEGRWLHAWAVHQWGEDAAPAQKTVINTIRGAYASFRDQGIVPEQ